MSNDRAIKFLGDMQRLDLKDGDRFVLTVDAVLSDADRRRIQEAWAKFVGGDTERFNLLMLERGMKLGVISGVN